MLISLPHSLLALVICFLETRGAWADSLTPATSPTAHFGNIGDYVASGLGINNGSTSQTSALAPATTGTGREYASSCADALMAWSSSSFDWQWDHAIISTSTFSSGFTETLQKPGSTKVTSVITLCDGYPRVVGHTSVSHGKKYTSTVAWTNTITESSPNQAYPTPPPCSIQPSDCEILSRSYDASQSSALREQGWATGAGPLCTVTPLSSYSYSYSTNIDGQTCDNCMIAAATARVMFWLITTAAGHDLCNNTASTITASPTGPPNSFVTEGITITSPMVAVSLQGMSRVDGCGTTIDHTIIPVYPDQVSSVRGFRALFSHHRFNFADLNYFCMDTNTTEATIPDGRGDSCYQQVPAAAYFGGLNEAVVYDQAPFRNMSKADMTIWDNYQPQLLPPQTMTSAITSLWGNDCIIHPDGVWDPPIALTPEVSLDLPTLPAGYTTTETGEAEATPASPINSYGPVPPGLKGPTLPPTGESTSHRQHFTALPEETSGASSDSQGDQSSGNYASGAAESNAGGSGSSNGDNDGSSNSGSDNDGSSNDNSANRADGPTQSTSGNNGDADAASNSNGASEQENPGSHNGDNQGSRDGPDVDAGSGQDGSESNTGSESNENTHAGDTQGSHGASGSDDNVGQSGSSGPTRINVHTTIITIGNEIVQCTQNSDGAWIIPDISTTRTASPGGPVVEMGDVTMTAGASGLVNVDAQNTVLTVGNRVISCSQDSRGAWIIPDISTTHTASPGGPAIEMDGATMIAGACGLVNINAQNTVLTVGNKVISCSQNSHGAWIVPEASATHTVSQGGSAVEIDGITFSAASEGLVKAHVTTTSGSLRSSADSNSADTQSASAAQSDRAQLTGATSSNSAASATNAGSSGAGSIRLGLSSLALALLSLCICML